MKLYFLGIAGAGVSALASVCKSRGDQVSGSDDAAFPPVTTLLEAQGIPFFGHFAVENLPPDIDLAVIGASAKLGGTDNPEWVELQRRRVPCLTFPALLAELTAARTNLIVAGSFGKSTLTDLIAFLLVASGRDPGYFIGAMPLDLPTSGWFGTSPEFIIEGDEYVVSMADRRSKFELYRPSHTLISSVVHDHVNMFPNMADYEASFARLIANTPETGKLVCAWQYEPLRRLCNGRAPVWYGLAADMDGAPSGAYRARDIVVGEVSHFTLDTPRHGAFPLAVQTLGLHNIENVVGAAALLLELELITPEQLQAATPGFLGVARRLDKKTKISAVPVYEGFGSSYEKARSAIEAVQLHFPGRRLIVVFEPHTFSWRNAQALEWYDTVFAGVDLVLMLPPPEHGAATHQQLNQAEIVARVEATGHSDVHPMANGADVRAFIAQHMQRGDVILLLSSGPLDGLATTLPAQLDGTLSA